jgi:hypothetical protein
MDVVFFAVDLDIHVAVGVGFGSRDDSVAVLVATEVGNLGFGGQFGGFDHFCFVFVTVSLNSKCLFKRPPGKTPKGKKWNPQNGQWNDE